MIYPTNVKHLFEMRLRDIRKEGEVKKRSRWLGIWRSRWAVLDGHFLFTFKRKPSTNEEQPTEVLNLKEFTCEEAKIGSPYCFKLSNNMESFFLDVDSNKERIAWIRAIYGCVREHQPLSFSDYEDNDVSATNLA